MFWFFFVSVVVYSGLLLCPLIPFLCLSFFVFVLFALWEMPIHRSFTWDSHTHTAKCTNGVHFLHFSCVSLLAYNYYLVCVLFRFRLTLECISMRMQDSLRRSFLTLCVCVWCVASLQREVPKKRKKLKKMLNCEFCEWKDWHDFAGYSEQRKRIAELIQLKKTLVNWKKSEL